MIRAKLVEFQIITNFKTNPISNSDRYEQAHKTAANLHGPVSGTTAPRSLEQPEKFDSAIPPFQQSLIEHFSDLKIENSPDNIKPNRVIDVTPLLQGEDSSPAASLDYALSKQPGWFVDMFGVNSESIPNSKLILERDNPDRKRPGPVSIFLKTSVLPVQNIAIRLDNRPTNARDLQWLLARIIEQLEPKVVAKKIPSKEKQPRSQDALKASDENGHKRLKPNKPTQISSTVRLVGKPQHIALVNSQKTIEREREKNLTVEELREVLKNLSIEESIRMLRNTKIFSRSDLDQTLRRINDHPLFKSLSGNRLLVLSLDQALGPSARLGVSEFRQETNQILRSYEPIEFAIDATSVPSIVLFHYLKKYRNLDLKLNYNFADTTELVAKLVSGGIRDEIDGFMLSAASAATFLNKAHKSDYFPLMILPKASHRVVASPESSPELSTGNYLMMQDIPGTSRFYFETLVSRAQVNLKNVTTSSMDADEIFSILRNNQSDFRSLIFFPHYRLNNIFNGCIYLDQENNVGSGIEHVLFLHRRFLKSNPSDKTYYSSKIGFAELLDIELRNAWLTLRVDLELLIRLINDLFDNHDYYDIFLRCCGLHNII